MLYQKVREISQNPDPDRDIKTESTRHALGLYAHIKNLVESSEDPLLAGIPIAILGKVIDYGPGKDFTIEHELGEILYRPFAIFDYDKFRHYVSTCDDVLYLADNAGECVFDRILIEQIRKPVTYAVRGHPVINDASMEDALEAGIYKVATILSSGTDAPGAILNTCSDEFLHLFPGARFIIAKGQGNYKALSDKTFPIFFLLKAKCLVIADDIGVGKGDIVLKKNDE